MFAKRVNRKIGNMSRFRFRQHVLESWTSSFFPLWSNDLLPPKRRTVAARPSVDVDLVDATTTHRRDERFQGTDRHGIREMLDCCCRTSLASWPPIPRPPQLGIFFLCRRILGACISFKATELRNNNRMRQDQPRPRPTSKVTTSSKSLNVLPRSF